MEFPHSDGNRSDPLVDAADLGDAGRQSLEQLVTLRRNARLTASATAA
jgi:hypothetical protein